MKRNRLVIVVLALFTLAVGVAVFLLIDRSTESTKTLPDGSVLTLRRITKGTKHRYVSGNLLQRNVGRALPERWAKKLGAQVVGYNSSNDTHFLWLERVGSSNLLRGAAFASGFSLRITTDAGFDRIYSPEAGLVTPASEVRGFQFEAVPTDSRRIQVTAGRNPFDRSTCVTLDVPNPNFIARRRWPVQPCPVSVEQDAVSLRLEGFTTRAEEPIGAKGLAWTELSFVIGDRAVSTNNWFARSVRIFNEAGTEFAFVLPPDATVSRTKVSFLGGLSSAEPYKLRFELRRTSYGPDDQRVFVAVPVPKVNGPTSEPLRAQLQGFTLVSTVSQGGGVTARIEPPTSDWRLDPVRVVDDLGRWLLVRGSSSNDGRFSGTVALETNSVTVDLTFGLTRLRTLELIARPSLGP
jgi:hypothetical protein